MYWRIAKELRDYQREAVKWATQRQRAVCCLPTGTGKTLVGILWLKELFEKGLITHAIIVEPTRLLVNQTSDYFRNEGGVNAVPIDGHIAREKREHLWTEPIVVCTAQTACNDLPYLRSQAAVVDECHHTVGQHAFAKLISSHSFDWRLGLSATVPEKRRGQIEAQIGSIRFWNWSDPQIQPYVPNWIGEVFEADLSDEEKEVLGEIRRLKRGLGLNPGMLERYLTRDGSDALRQTLSRRNKLATAFGDLLPRIPERLHKLDVLREVFDSHDFEKAVVFVDRVSIAREIVNQFPELEPVMFVGKSGRDDQKKALGDSKRQGTRLIASTSAGEEGVDLPSADLLVIWGNAASDIRFIQRLGRIMRKVGEGLKFATFAVTPASNDFDSFAEGLFNAAESGVIEVDKAFGWDPEILWPKTTWWHVSGLLRERPAPLPVLEERLDVRGSMAEKIVQHATRRGRVFYVYDVAQIATDSVTYYLQLDSARLELAGARKVMQSLSNEYRKTSDPVALAREIAHVLSGLDAASREALRSRLLKRLKKFSVKAKEERDRQYRIFLLIEDANNAASLLPKQVAMATSVPMLIYGIEQGRQGGVIRGLSGSLSRLMFLPKKGSHTLAEVWESAINQMWGQRNIGFALGDARSCELEYYFRPLSMEEFAATVGNMVRLLSYREVFEAALNICAQCGRLGAAPRVDPIGYTCSACWQSVPSIESCPSSLLEFGTPLPIMEERLGNAVPDIV